MPANLTDNDVANTYKGVLHLYGEELPVNTKVQVYDGAGNETAIKLGDNSIDCLSLSAYGLTANDFKYPDTPGGIYSVLCQTSNGATGEINTLELKNIKEVLCQSGPGAPSYSRASLSGVPIVTVECGIVRSVNEVGITNITEAAGGVDVDKSGNYIVKSAAIDKGIVKGLSLIEVSLTPQPNLLINAQGFINQRQATSNAALPSVNWNPERYFLDRWKSVNGSSVTWRYDGVGGASNRNVATITAGSAGICQIIEKINIVPGTHVLSWIGSATADVVEGTATRAQGNGIVPGQTTRFLSVEIGGGHDVKITFKNGDFKLPKFERGAIRTEFDYRSFGSELLLCQRYFCKTYAYDIAPGENAIGSIQSHTTEPVNPTLHNNGWRFPVELRTKINNRAWVFNPGTGTINQFRYFEGGDGRSRFFTKPAKVSEWTTSGITHVENTDQDGGLAEGTMRMFDTHYVADAEF